MSASRENYEQQNLQQQGATIDEFTLERYAQFERHLPTNCTTVLDVGCADGRGGTRLKELRSCLSIRGLDCVEERLAALPAAYDARILGLSSSIPLEDQSLDAIVAGEFLEHLYPADVDKTLCEFQRVLKIGGRLLMTTPHPTCYLNRFGGRTVYGTSHLTQHHPKLLAARLLMHGFNNVTLRGSGKATRRFGERFPFFGVYGSYLIWADKI
jgi:ubiquinone/menaquinone biosynthesis C-methylase UbiE